MPSVVSLRLLRTRTFDTQNAGSGVATGFVVDAERGLILTNRHVVSPGPVRIRALFHDQEELPVQVVYRDPVHDFGLLQFDPSALPDPPPALDLHPGAARVGIDVRVVGNDAGEKLAILEGTLARLDRPAPSYGSARYNDWNTFYLQAASGTTGGSSGSPVIDQRGRVLALNAGAKKSSAASYYLPLQRVVEALSRIQRAEPVPRGGLLVAFRHWPWEELARLGLKRAKDADLKREHTGSSGLLVVDRLVPGTAAAAALVPGDVLIAVDGRPIADFDQLEQALDAAVGRTVAVDLERSSKPRTAHLPVADLHGLTPTRFLELGGAVLLDVSLQQAMGRHHELRGVAVAANGYTLQRAGVPAGAVIEQLGDTPTPKLSDLEAAWQRLAQGELVPLRWHPMGAASSPRTSVISVDRRWHPSRACAFDDGWACRDLDAPAQAAAHAPSDARHPPVRSALGRRLRQSLVWVDVDLPFRVDAASGSAFEGNGLVVDAERGLVLVDRNTVPTALGEVQLTFAGSVRVPAAIRWLHPLHGYAVVQYDPAAVGDTPVRAARLRPNPLHPGAPVSVVGLDRDQLVAVTETVVERFDSLVLPVPSSPAFRETNLDVAFLRDDPVAVGGAVVDSLGRIVALWASESYEADGEAKAVWAAIPADVLLEGLEPLRRGEQPSVRTLGAELVRESVADARDRGLPAELAHELARAGGTRPGVLRVLRVEPGTPAATFLKEGDLLLRAGGVPLSTFRDVERASREPTVVLDVWRDAVVTLPLLTTVLDGRGTTRAVLWAGLLVQEPHREVALQQGRVAEGVYISLWWRGSPAQQAGLRATRRIVKVGSRPTPDLDAFLAAVAALRPSGQVRVVTRDRRDREQATTFRTDPLFWPTVELRKAEDGTWERHER